MQGAKVGFIPQKICSVIVLFSVHFEFWNRKKVAYYETVRNPEIRSYHNKNQKGHKPLTSLTKRTTMNLTDINV